MAGRGNLSYCWLIQRQRNIVSIAVSPEKRSQDNVLSVFQELGISLFSTSCYLSLVVIRAHRLILIHDYTVAAKVNIPRVKFVGCSWPDFLMSRVQA